MRRSFAVAIACALLGVACGKADPTGTLVRLDAGRTWTGDASTMDSAIIETDAGTSDASSDAASDDAATADATVGMDGEVLTDAGALHDAANDAFLAADSAMHDAGMDGAISDAALDSSIDANMDGAIDASIPPTDDFINQVITHPSQPPISPFATCNVTTQETLTNIHQHVPVCSSLPIRSLPPTEGPHYPLWAAYQAYDSPVPYGFLIHAMEHGGVVIWHKCLPAECPDLVAALRNIADTYPADSLCSATPARNRIVVVPDPNLDVPIAATAWQHMYKATCLDTASLTDFVATNYQVRASENFCSAGVDETSVGWCPDAGM